MVLWAHKGQLPRWYLDEFSPFCRAHECDQQNRPTMLLHLKQQPASYTLDLMQPYNTNTRADVYGAVLTTQPLLKFTWFISSYAACKASREHLPTLRPSQQTWAASPPVSHLLLLLPVFSPKPDTHFMSSERVED